MHTRADHLLTGLEARGDHHLVAIDHAHLNRLATDRHAGHIEHPHRSARTLLAQSAGGQLDHARLAARQLQSLHIHSAAQRQSLGRFQGQLDGVGARDRVGTGGQFTHLALQGLTCADQRGLHFLTYFQGQGHRLWDGEDRIAGSIVGQSHHRLACGDHLADFGIHTCDHARLAGRQTGVTSLVGLGLRLGFGLVQLRIGSFQARFATLQLGTADEVLRLQGFKALEVCQRQITLTLRRHHLCRCSLCSQLVVFGIDQGQQLTCRHALPLFGWALNQLASHLEAQS